jgi:hypothetical protein
VDLLPDMGTVGGDGHGDTLYTQYDPKLFINISVENFLLNYPETVFNKNALRLPLHSHFTCINTFLNNSSHYFTLKRFYPWYSSGLMRGTREGQAGTG